MSRTGGRSRGRTGVWARAMLLCVCATVPLSACDDNALKVQAAIQQADTADQVLDSVYHVVTKDGMRQSIVEADTAYYYEQSETFELRNLRVTFFKANGAETSVLTAKEGTFRTRLGKMEARQTVVVRSVDGRALFTEILRYDQNLNQLSTDQPFTFTGPTSNGSGVGFVSDPEFRNVTGSQGRGTESQGAGKFVPPGQ